MNTTIILNCDEETKQNEIIEPLSEHLHILLLESFNYGRDNYRNFDEHREYIETIDTELLMNYVLDNFNKQRKKEIINFILNETKRELNLFLKEKLISASIPNNIDNMIFTTNNNLLIKSLYFQGYEYNKFHQIHTSEAKVGDIIRTWNHRCQIYAKINRITKAYIWFQQLRKKQIYYIGDQDGSETLNLYFTNDTEGEIMKEFKRKDTQYNLSLINIFKDDNTTNYILDSVSYCRPD